MELENCMNSRMRRIGWNLICCELFIAALFLIFALFEWWGYIGVSILGVGVAGWIFRDMQSRFPAA